MRVVSNQEFDEAFKDLNNIKLMNSVIKKYRKSLSSDDIRSIRMSALWKCLSKHNPDMGQKFTSSLYRYTSWECLQVLSQNKTVKTKQLTKNIEYNINREYNDILLDLNNEDKEFLSRYTEGKYTFKELGKLNGKSGEWARLKLLKIKDKLLSS